MNLKMGFENEKKRFDFNGYAKEWRGEERVEMESVPEPRLRP